ncbi:MAG: hypothetical protein PF692_15130 [Kiritimatiellae bacterium]|jgi:hypothetical protein|nr:hypothetical protein [Kiritimatiellia bacterium]
MSDKTYKIEAQEFLSKIIEGDAKNQNESISKIKEIYHSYVCFLSSLYRATRKR